MLSFFRKKIPEFIVFREDCEWFIYVKYESFQKDDLKWFTILD